MRKFTIAFLVTIHLAVLPLSANDLVRGPYLQDGQPTEITVMWETEMATIGKVRFGANSRILTQSSAENEPQTLHQIKLENLKPNQTYYYQCTWKKGKTTQGKFITAPADALTPFRIAVVGDSRSDLVMSVKISNMIVDKNPQLVLHTGDLVANGNNLGEWNTYLFNPMEKLLRNIPLYPVLGNHEQESPYYYKYFPLHNQKPWWSVDYGSVHIIGLDTSIPTDPQSEQFQFLREDLKNNKKPWTIIVFHYPLFHTHPSRPIQEFRHEWQLLFMEYGVDLVLTGHDHYYQRTFPIGQMSERQQGVVHITTAGGGANLYPTISQSYSAYDRSLYHYLLIDVTEDELEIRAIDENNQTFDAIILNKNQDHSAANFVEYGMFELEREINAKLGSLAPGKNKKGIVFFDTTLTMEPHFYMPVSGTYKWQASDKWNIEQPSQEFTINPGEKLQIRLKAQVNKKHFMPTPALSLHLEADNSSRNITKRRPYQKSLGFRNQDLQFSIEEAVYKNAVSTPAEDLTPLFFFLNYYADSEYAYDVLVTLGNQILGTMDKRILPNLEAFLKNNPSDLNKYRIYPFYFLFEDFKNLEEWMEIIGRLPSEQLSFAPKLICQLSALDIFNSRTIKNWHLIGPFDASDRKGLATIYGPEVDPNLAKKYKSSTGGEIIWKQYQSTGSYIDLIDALAVPVHASSNLVAYAQAEVLAEKAGEVLLLLGTDDDPVVWVNGIEILRKEVGRGLKPCEDILLVPLKAGKNELLIKVVQRGGAWNLDLRVSDWMGILR